ncbi:MAG: PaaI family thioesterase [Caenispirillum bisanense]|nr:PaaI family thioesterase [Caenispirillum bisanense]MCA1972023.1 PaaI family thioesterase [Caenispirillum sp.]
MPGLSRDQITEMQHSLFAPWVQDLALVVESVDADRAVVRLPFSDRLTRIGGTVCGQALMALADTAMVFLVSGAFGEFRPMTTVSQTTNFMKALSGRDVIAEARLLRLGRTMAFGDVFLRADGDEAPAVHVASTYAILPQKG